jgi:hypothetical protein
MKRGDPALHIVQGTIIYMRIADEDVISKRHSKTSRRDVSLG